MVTLLVNLTPIFGWCMARLVKNGCYNGTCYDEIGVG